MNDLSNYSRRQQKKIKKVFGGGTMGLMAWYIIIFIYVLILSLLIFGSLRSKEALEDRIFTMVLFLFFAALLVGTIMLVLKYRKISKAVAEKYKNQPDNGRAELAACALNYKAADGIRCSSNYIYGMMPVGIGLSEKQSKMMKFYYIMYPELLWVYKYDRNFAVKENRMIHTNYSGNQQSNGYIMIYDVNGNIYNAPMANTDYMKLCDTIHSINTDCRIGYDQENIEWMNNYRRTKMR